MSEHQNNSPTGANDYFVLWLFVPIELTVLLVACWASLVAPVQFLAERTVQVLVILAVSYGMMIAAAHRADQETRDLFLGSSAVIAVILVLLLNKPLPAFALATGLILLLALHRLWIRGRLDGWFQRLTIPVVVMWTAVNLMLLFVRMIDIPAFAEMIQHPLILKAEQLRWTGYELVLAGLILKSAWDSKSELKPSFTPLPAVRPYRALAGEGFISFILEPLALTALAFIRRVLWAANALLYLAIAVSGWLRGTAKRAWHLFVDHFVDFELVKALARPFGTFLVFVAFAHYLHWSSPAITSYIVSNTSVFDVFPSHALDLGKAVGLFLLSFLLIDGVVAVWCEGCSIPRIHETSAQYAVLILLSFFISSTIMWLGALLMGLSCFGRIGAFTAAFLVALAAAILFYLLRRATWLSTPPSPPEAPDQADPPRTPPGQSASERSSKEDSDGQDSNQPGANAGAAEPTITDSSHREQSGVVERPAWLEPRQKRSWRIKLPTLRWPRLGRKRGSPCYRHPYWPRPNRSRYKFGARRQLDHPMGYPGHRTAQEKSSWRSVALVLGLVLVAAYWYSYERKLRDRDWMSRLTQNPVVPWVGMAGLEVGANQAEAIGALGEPSWSNPIRLSDGEVLWHAFGYQKDGMSLNLYVSPDEKQIIGFRLSDDQFDRTGRLPRLEGQVGIGDTLDRVLSTLGEPHFTETHNTCPPDDEGHRRATTYLFGGVSLWLCDYNAKVYLIDVPPRLQSRESAA
jgi:hypothetical protein